MLVKEIRKLESGTLITGHPVVWGSNPAVWFVMVKDVFHVPHEDVRRSG